MAGRLFPIRLCGNGQATATVNLPANAVDLFGNDLYFAVLTFDNTLINDIEDVSVGVHVKICPGDIDHDGTVGIGDFLAVLGTVGAVGGALRRS